jgi:hypothetical protein
VGSRVRRGLVAAPLVLAALLVALGTQRTPAHASLDSDPYSGLGAWVSLFTPEWADPQAAIAALSENGVRTLYIETGRSNTRAAIARPQQTAEFVADAHAVGMQVVAWYYPTFVLTQLDIARTLQTARFRTPDGQGFDGVAIDIEDASVRNVARRNARLLAYTRAITQAIPDEAWGAITYPPVGLDLSPHAWPGFPWAAVGRAYSAILPMAYWRPRFHTPASAAWYAAGNLAALSVLTGRDDLEVHLVGSAGGGAAQDAAFVKAALAGGAQGLSLFPAAQVTPAEWAAIGHALNA